MLKGLTGEQNKILQEINKLSNDEDVRQELWVQYLTTGCLPFSAKLEKIKLDSEHDLELAQLIMQLMTSTSPQSAEIQEIIHSLTDLERSIVACLLIHLDVHRISWYKDISPIRISQVIATIRNNSRWEEVWRLRDDSQMQNVTDLLRKK